MGTQQYVDVAIYINIRGSSMAQASQARTKEFERVCDDLKAAVDGGSIGEIVKANQDLIMRYYNDVLEHADRSFNVARVSAIIGFAIFILTLIYAVVVDRFGNNSEAVSAVSKIGILSGLIVQVFAGVTFYLYQKASDQFAAFHICLERTHRYLVAYKIADKMKENKDETLRDLVCIMAKAPMISRITIVDEDNVASKVPVSAS
jgi:hypothetical protein